MIIKLNKVIMKQDIFIMDLLDEVQISENELLLLDAILEIGVKEISIYKDTENPTIEKYRVDCQEQLFLYRNKRKYTLDQFFVGISRKESSISFLDSHTNKQTTILTKSIEKVEIKKSKKINMKEQVK